MLRIPTSTTDPLYDFRITLDQREYLITIDYSQLEDRYYMSLALGDGTSMVRGWKLVPNVALGLRIADRRMPGGLFFVKVSTNDDSPPGFGELGVGQRCELWYMTKAEVEELQPAVVVDPQHGTSVPV